MSFRLHYPLAAPLLALGLPLQAAGFSGNATLTSDYVFRGISQSDESAAWQAGARVDGHSRLYGSVWGSRVAFASKSTAHSEIDYVVGARRQLSEDWSGDLHATWFTYTGAPELNYLEWIATATWRERRWVMLGVSRDVFASGRSGVYAQAGMRVPLTEAVRLELASGYYRLERAYARDYAHAQAALAWQPNPMIELRLSGHLTDHDARALFGDLAGPRLEASLQASY